MLTFILWTLLILFVIHVITWYCEMFYNFIIKSAKKPVSDYYNNELGRTERLFFYSCIGLFFFCIVWWFCI